MMQLVVVAVAVVVAVVAKRIVSNGSQYYHALKVSTAAFSVQILIEKLYDMEQFKFVTFVTDKTIYRDLWFR